MPFAVIMLSEYKALHELFQALDLTFVEQVLERSYGRRRTGRHPRSLLDQFKTELLKRVARIESYEELHRLLQNDKDLCLLCDIKDGEKPYHPSTLSRFRKRIGPEALQQVMAHCVKQLDQPIHKRLKPFRSYPASKPQKYGGVIRLLTLPDDA
jgi:hypothetical protein